MKPEVSVIVAAFNVEEYLGRCIRSICEQTLRSLELIVVNDGSTDGSGRVCDELAAQDSRIRVIHKPNGGLSDARNAGLRLAAGRYVAFLDGDDWAEETMLADLVAAADESSSDIVVAGCIVDAEDASSRVRSSTVRVPVRQLLVPGDGTVETGGHFLSLLGYAWNKLYRRELLVQDRYQFERGLTLIEDVVFNAAVVALAARVLILDKAHVHYVQRPRETLGAREYHDFLALRIRGIECLEAMLAYWGVPAKGRREALSLDCHLALRALVRRASLLGSSGIIEQSRYLRSERYIAASELRASLAAADNVPMPLRIYCRAFFILPPFAILLLEKGRRTVWRTLSRVGLGGRGG